MPQREMDRRGGDRSHPLHTPAMAGGLFSIDRNRILLLIEYREFYVLNMNDNINNSEAQEIRWTKEHLTYIIGCKYYLHIRAKFDLLRHCMDIITFFDLNICRYALLMHLN